MGRVVTVIVFIIIIFQPLTPRASRRTGNLHAASRAQATELSRLRPESLAGRRQRDIQAKVRSTTQRRDGTVKPLVPSGPRTVPAAESTGFNFDEWFENNVMNKPDDIPAVYIRFALSAARDWVHCETRASYEETRWCRGGPFALLAVEIAVPSKGPRSRPKRDLEIGIEWATATGETGYGQSAGDGRVIIPAGQFDSPNFTIDIPDDSIAHPCNKLIVTLRSLTPDRYKIAPLNAGGSLVLEYVDDDGANPDNEPC